MSFRKRFLAATLLTASLGALSSVSQAADTKPIVREDCSFETLVRDRHAGHPGKSIPLPKRPARLVAECPQEQRRTLVMASYTDSPGGTSLVRGQTRQALEQLQGRRDSRKSNFELTNQCVAHTILRQFSEAEALCDAAVDRALAVRKGASNRLGITRRMFDRDVGVAYSNRAVMHLLSGDEVAAHQDLSQARKLTPNASYVMRNVEAAGREPALAAVAPIG
jgi:hypothetical protein